MEQIIVSKITFMRTLTDLLLLVEQGMIAFEEPLPREVVQGIIDASAGFKADILPFLHDILEKDADGSIQLVNRGYIIDVIGKIADDASTSYLIRFHQNSSNYATSAAILAALRRIASNDSYGYLASILQQYIDGEKYIIQSSLDIHIACNAMQDWKSNKALKILKLAVAIEDVDRMPEKALRAIATFPGTTLFLKKMAEENPELNRLILELLSDN